MDFTPGRPLRAYDQTGRWRDYSTDELVGSRLNYYENWACGLGVDNLFINPDGDVYGASCKVGGKLGNIYEDFTVPSAWMTCTMKVCSCGSDLFIPKSRTLQDAALLRKTQSLPTDAGKMTADIMDIAALERTHASNVKQIYWEIGRRCNFDCSYCWPWIHNNHERHKSLDELITATKKIQEKFIGDSSCNWIISGGEPTANSAFLDWCRYINAAGYHLSMHSNGSRKPDYYQELIRYGDLNLSAHYEFWDSAKFLEVVAAVTAAKVSVGNLGVGHLEVKLMMKPGTSSETLAFEQRLKAIPEFVNYCTWAIVPIRDGKRGDQIMEGYSNSDFELFGDRNGK
jgi:organic radical activating enzyme